MLISDAVGQYVTATCQAVPFAAVQCFEKRKSFHGGNELEGACCLGAPVVGSLRKAFG